MALLGGNGDENFPKLLHEQHMPDIYRRLFLLSLFYGAILGVYAKQLTEADFESDPNNYLKIRKKYNVFSNNLWYFNISTQVQGVELFKLMLDQSASEVEFNQIQHELSTSTEIAQIESDQKTENFQRRISTIGIFIPLVAIILDGPALLGFILDPVEFSLRSNGHIFALILCVGLATCVGLFAWAWIRQKDRR